ncbi:MAG: Asp-tRNA(Asn)/Glu-tRNA(Gln) amidotransferase subunit GatC [Dehalococcoidia bacterium]
MSLSEAEVEHIAKLARVGVTQADVEKFQRQLSVILDAFQALQAVNTDDVPPTAQTLPLANVERADQPRPSYPVEQVLANAPLRDDSYFRVRKILE